MQKSVTAFVGRKLINIDSLFIASFLSSDK